MKSRVRALQSYLVPLVGLVILAALFGLIAQVAPKSAYAPQTAHAGTANITGFAWSDNIGWICFDDATYCSTSNVTVDTSTGALSGDAWSETVGWINFGSNSCGAQATLSAGALSGFAQIVSDSSCISLGGYVTNPTPTVVTFTTSSNWTVPTGVTSVNYLVVGGGGGGAGAWGGGGGAGGVLTGTLAVTPGTLMTVTVGSGGNGSDGSVSGSNGQNSVFGSITALGGGGGGRCGSSGNSGGSGGGGGYYCNSNYGGGAGTSGQGYGGGNGSVWSGYGTGGGGGGAGGAGASATTGAAGNGGTGIASSISGSSVYYGGGGGGGQDSGKTQGAGGAGGGGAGASNNGTGASGTANTGGGGGGAGNPGQGGNGGSGVVIISYYATTGTYGPTLSGNDFNGWAWGSDTAGWISFNCATGGPTGNNICATSNYKVSFAGPGTPTCTLSSPSPVATGSALTFAYTTTNSPSSGTLKDSSNNTIYSGAVSSSGNIGATAPSTPGTYTYTMTVNSISGSNTCQATVTAQTDVCSDISGIQTSEPAGCTGTPPSCIQAGYTYNGSSCVPSNATINTFSGPTSVRKGDTATLTYNITNGTTCSITGTNGYSSGGLTLPSGSVTTTAIPASTVFTLSCNGATQTITVGITPSYQEQ